MSSLVQTSGNLFLEGHTQKIIKTLEDIKSSFIYVGFLLWEIQHYKYYESSGYTSLEDYSFNVLGFKKSTTYNFIKVCCKFSNLTSAGYPSITIKDEYKDYNFSQLCEMTSLKDDDMKSISSKTSVRQIKEIKKSSKFSPKFDSVVSEMNNSEFSITTDKYSKNIEELEGLLEVKESTNDILRKSNDNLQSVIDDLKKDSDSSLSIFQYKLLNFFVDNYYENFIQDYQSKFDKSKKLNRVFGVDKIDIAIEMGKIHECLSGIFNPE